MARGANTYPAVKPVDTHIPRQNGQVTSSPMVFLLPLARTYSASSAGPVVPSNLVNGARRGLVTGSLASSRLSLCVASVVTAASQGLIRSGSERPLSFAATAMAPTSPPYTDMAPA